MQGLDLILNSINCEKYKQKLDEYGINQDTMLDLTANDLRVIDIDNKDIPTMLATINVLNKTRSSTEVKLS